MHHGIGTTAHNLTLLNFIALLLEGLAWFRASRAALVAESTASSSSAPGKHIHVGLWTSPSSATLSNRRDVGRQL